MNADEAIRESNRLTALRGGGSGTAVIFSEGLAVNFPATRPPGRDYGNCQVFTWQEIENIIATRVAWQQETMQWHVNRLRAAGQFEQVTAPLYELLRDYARRELAPAA